MTGEGEFQAGLESLRRLVALAISPSLCVPQGVPFDVLPRRQRPPRRPVRAVRAPAGLGSGEYGDADQAISSEEDEGDRTRLIALVELARNGDKDAFGLLYDHYQPSVYRFLYYRTRSATLAEDLTADTFFRALRSMNNFRWQGRDFGAWLMTIARNLTTDHFKAGRTRLEMTTEDMGRHDDVTEGPEAAVLASLTNEVAAGGADPAADRAARVPDHAVPARAEHRRDGSVTGPFRRRDQAAAAARGAQPGEADAGRVA